MIFAHYQNASQRLLAQDSFKDLLNAVFVPNIDELAIVPFTGGMCGSVGGYSGGTGGSGSAGGLAG